jgi:hypothetical protein
MAIAVQGIGRNGFEIQSKRTESGLKKNRRELSSPPSASWKNRLARGL